MLPLGPTWMWKMCDGRLCRYPANSCRTFTCGTTVHLAPFTGYACVSISMNYRLTHRTTDGTGPYVSNTNVSLHKSITRNIFCAFKAQLMARGKGVGYGGSDWKSIWWKTILFWFCTRTTNQLIVAIADLEAPPRKLPTCCMCHFARGASASASAIGDSQLLSCAATSHSAVSSNCLIVGANELITPHLTLIASHRISRISFQ